MSGLLMGSLRESGWGTVWVFLALFLVWWLLDGSQSLLVGVGTAAVASGLYLWLRARRSYRLHILNLPHFCAYFIIESFRGGVDVALRALNPRLPIHPHLFDYPVSLPAGQPRVFFLSVLSVLPGTLSADLSDDERVIRVHAINENPMSAVVELEQRIARLYGLEGGGSC